MGTAFTPGLKVTKRTTIEKTRRLPIPGETLVQIGQSVRALDPVARAQLSGDLDTIHLNQVLGVEPVEVERYLHVKEGDQVKEGQVLAEMKAFFGVFKSKATAPCTGKIEFYSKITGHLGVRRPPVPIEINAYIDGEICDIMPREGVVVRANGAMIQGIFGVGGERQGQIKVCVASPDKELRPEDLTGDLKGKIVVGGALARLETFKRAAELGVRGLVTGGIIDQDLADFLGYDIGVAVTGHEDIPITLIVTEGFGTMAMAKRTFDLLSELQGQNASINGATQIRAGAMRPEIIIPETDLSAKAVETNVEASMELSAGTPIRVIRVPYFGLLGKVVELPHELLEIGTGSKVRVLKAKLNDGRTVTVPRANVEIIQA